MFYSILTLQKTRDYIAIGLPLFRIGVWPCPYIYLPWLLHLDENNVPCENYLSGALIGQWTVNKIYKLLLRNYWIFVATKLIKLFKLKSNLKYNLWSFEVTNQLILLLESKFDYRRFFLFCWYSIYIYTFHMVSLVMLLSLHLRPFN